MTETKKSTSHQYEQHSPVSSGLDSALPVRNGVSIMNSLQINPNFLFSNSRLYNNQKPAVVNGNEIELHKVNDNGIDTRLMAIFRGKPG